MSLSSTPGTTNEYAGDGRIRPVDLESDHRTGQKELVSLDPPDGVPRTSNMWTAAAYNIIAIVGVGVLGLPYAMVFLGWGMGGVVLVLAFCITYFTMGQLITLHEFELVKEGVRYSTYHRLGQRAFGEKLGFRIIFPLQMVVEVSLDVLFVITAGEAMNRIHENLSPCHPVHLFLWFAVFAAIQIVLCFVVPTFESIKPLVVAGAIMSICYCTIAWITIVSVGGPEHVEYSHTESQLNLTRTNVRFHAFNGIGVVAFAYSAHNVVLEIQNGIPSTSVKSSTKEMSHAVWITYAVVALCYFPVAFAVYAVYGNQAVGNVLSFYMFHKAGTIPIGHDHVPRALNITANLMLIIHLIGSYQIFAVPVFTQLDIFFTRSSPYIVRPLYIVSTMALAMIFPYFSPLLGIIAGFAIAPTTYFLPCIIWLKIKNPKIWSKDWCFNWVCIILGVFLMIVASCGGLYVLIEEWDTVNNLSLWSNKWRQTTDFYSVKLKNGTCIFSSYI